MGFCTKCGNKLDDGAAFCNICGTQVKMDSSDIIIEGSGTSVPAATPSTGTIPAGNVTYQDVKRADAVVQEAYRYVAIAEEYEQKNEDLHTAWWSISPKPFLRVFGVGKTILIIVSMFIVLLVAAYLITEVGARAAGVIVIILYAIGYIWYWHSLRKANDREIEKFLQTAEDYLSNHQKDLSVIPGEYRFPMATEYIVKLFETGRVDNINDALNMLDEQIHRWKMESQMYELQAQMGVLGTNTKGAMGAAAAGLVFDIGSLLMRL